MFSSDESCTIQFNILDVSSTSLLGIFFHLWSLKEMKIYIAQNQYFIWLDNTLLQILELLKDQKLLT